MHSVEPALRARIDTQDDFMRHTTSLRRLLFVAPVLAVITASVGFGTNFFGTTQIATTLDDFVQPGTQPLTLLDNIFPASDCSACHGNYNFDTEPYRRWAASMMGQAGRDPLFYACMTIANQDVNDVGEMCLRCHAPGAWLQGRSVPADGSALDPDDGDLDGVTCHFCHRLVDPVAAPENPAADTAILASITGLNPEPHTGQYVIDPNDRRRGPFDLGPGFFWHSWELSPYHQESKLCGTCHDVSNPAYERVGGDYVLGTLGQQHPTHDKRDEFPVERTYSEWEASEYAVRAVTQNNGIGGDKLAVATCQDCHMPDTNGTACAPALNGAVRPDLPQHNFAGGNSWVLSAIRTLYPDDMETGLSQMQVDSATARTYEMLERATDMETFESNGRLVVRIVNQSGHKFPTGYAEGRRAWINVTFLDSFGNPIDERGDYRYSDAVLTTSDTKVYETDQGIDAAVAAATGLPVGKGFHFAVNNVIERDNRIPPRGFTNSGFVTAQASPVGAYFSDEQYWDDTSYSIPSGAVKAHVFLYFQTTSKAYIEFLRDENVTNSLGQVAYDQWELHGKSAPIGIDRSVINLTGTNCATPIAYGLSKETSIGSFPSLTADDLPSVASGSLTLRVTDGVPNAYAILISGTDTASVNWAGGKRFVGPLQRVASFGLDATGEGTITIPIPAGAEGTKLNYQVVFRDSLSSFGRGLTNGLAVDFCN